MDFPYADAEVEEYDSDYDSESSDVNPSELLSRMLDKMIHEYTQKH